MTTKRAGGIHITEACLPTGASSERPRITILLRQLDLGGSQRQAVELARALRFGCRITLATLYKGGHFTNDAGALEGVDFLSFDKDGRWDLFTTIARFVHHLRTFRPNVMISYPGLPNVLNLTFGRWFGVSAVHMIRSSGAEYSSSARPWQGFLSWVERALSVQADLVVANSWTGLKHYRERHPRHQRTVIIPNGFDTSRFHPDEAAGRMLRREWGISNGEVLIGMVGRLIPSKGYETFLKAAAIVCRSVPKCRFVVVGSGDSHYEHLLRSLSERYGLRERVTWAGPRSDMTAVYNALDLFTLTSKSEGFANVIGEAMACGIPCVVTAAGDSRVIVGRTGIVVEHSDPTSLARGWARLITKISQQPDYYSSQPRRRILQHFSCQKLCIRTLSVLSSLTETSACSSNTGLAYGAVGRTHFPRTAHPL